MEGTDIALGWVKRHEGLRLKPYTCTAGKLTIGYGRNLSDKGISPFEAELLLQSDLTTASRDASGFVNNFLALDVTRQAVLIDMAFNLGRSRLATFKKLKAAIEAEDFAQAAGEMTNSLWAQQVGGRALFLAEVMATGEANV